MPSKSGCKGGKVVKCGGWDNPSFGDSRTPCAAILSGYSIELFCCGFCLCFNVPSNKALLSMRNDHFTWLTDGLKPLVHEGLPL